MLLKSSRQGTGIRMLPGELFEEAKVEATSIAVDRGLIK